MNAHFTGHLGTSIRHLRWPLATRRFHFRIAEKQGNLVVEIGAETQIKPANGKTTRNAFQMISNDFIAIFNF